MFKQKLKQMSNTSPRISQTTAPPASLVTVARIYACETTDSISMSASTSTHTHTHLYMSMYRSCVVELSLRAGSTGWRWSQGGQIRVWGLRTSMTRGGKWYFRWSPMSWIELCTTVDVLSTDCTASAEFQATSQKFTSSAMWQPLKCLGAMSQ